MYHKKYDCIVKVKQEFLENDATIVKIENNFANSILKVKRRPKKYICSICNVCYRTKLQLNFHHEVQHVNKSIESLKTVTETESFTTDFEYVNGVQIKIEPELDLSGEEEPVSCNNML